MEDKVTRVEDRKVSTAASLLVAEAKSYIELIVWHPRTRVGEVCAQIRITMGI
jgi:hypothetical protein